MRFRRYELRHDFLTILTKTIAMIRSNRRIKAMIKADDRVNAKYFREVRIARKDKGAT